MHFQFNPHQSPQCIGGFGLIIISFFLFSYQKRNSNWKKIIVHFFCITRTQTILTVVTKPPAQKSFRLSFFGLPHRHLDPHCNFSRLSRKVIVARWHADTVEHGCWGWGGVRDNKQIYDLSIAPLHNQRWKSSKRKRRGIDWRVWIAHNIENELAKCKTKGMTKNWTGY